MSCAATASQAPGPSWPANEGALSNLDTSAALETLNTGLSVMVVLLARLRCVPQRKAQSLARRAVLDLQLGDVRSALLDTPELHLSGVYFTLCCLEGGHQLARYAHGGWGR